jgi:hypothetical protein
MSDATGLRNRLAAMCGKILTLITNVTPTSTPRLRPSRARRSKPGLLLNPVVSDDGAGTRPKLYSEEDAAAAATLTPSPHHRALCPDARRGAAGAFF